MDRAEVVTRVGDELLRKWLDARSKLDRIDAWARWDHQDPHNPSRKATDEYRELIKRAQAPWGDLIVGSIAQTLYVEGYRRPDAPEDVSGWRYWQANGMDGRQVAIHRAALTYGIAYGLVLPGVMNGEPMPVIRGMSPREMLALYEDPANDDWPELALRVRRTSDGYRIAVYDEQFVHHLTLENLAAKPEYVDVQEHGVGNVPVVRYANRFDLEGRYAGEIEPFIPLLGKIDQTSFDRLVVQRFASWIVRYVAGMDVVKSAEQAGVSIDQAVLKLKVNDILVSDNPDTRFGSLPATPLDGFIKAHEADLAALAAVSQTPAFELLGQMANLSAEALAAAKASQTAKSEERRKTFGEAHEQLIRLACHVAGDADGAADFAAEVRWADTSIRSLAQAVDALGKLHQMLGFPPHLLWKKVPGFSQQDVDEAVDFVRDQEQRAREQDPIVELLRQTSTVVDQTASEMTAVAGGAGGSVG